jgi:hypothetical protein
MWAAAENNPGLYIQTPELLASKWSTFVVVLGHAVHSLAKISPL